MKFEYKLCNFFINKTLLIIVLVKKYKEFGILLLRLFLKFKNVIFILVTIVGSINLCSRSILPETCMVQRYHLRIFLRH